MKARSAPIPFLSFIIVTVAAASLQAQQYSVNFGDVQVGLWKDSTFVLTNTSPLPIVITSVTILHSPSDFAILSGGGPVTVPPNASHTVVMRFTPSALGLRTDSAVVSGLFPGSPVYVELLGNGIPLPVELTAFSVVRHGGTILLKWTVAAETNNVGFEVQRAPVVAGSGGPAVFETIGFVAGRGTAHTPADYVFEDALSPSGDRRLLFYRLRQVDADGGAHVSPVIEVGPETVMPALSLAPNPSRGRVTLSFVLDEPGRVQWQVYDLTGRCLYTSEPSLFAVGVYHIPLETVTLPAGMYLLRFTAGEKRTHARFTLTR
ncbi:MAG: choice-of-anchor D domain-containing protein [Bacteroidota bacterium]|nr:choice-of-anchor D domain-containing protein [Bacteroidota bacterium]